MAKASLRRILDETPRRRGGHSCRTCGLLEDLRGDDQLALQDYLSSDVSSSLIVEALSRYGVTISVSALSRHRRECPPLD